MRRPDRRIAALRPPSHSDQTGVQLMPTGSSTMAPIGSPKVAITGGEDKRAITAFLTTSSAGKKGPMQGLGPTGPMRAVYIAARLKERITPLKKVPVQRMFR